jgi:hypothetical protein
MGHGPSSACRSWASAAAITARFSIGCTARSWARSDPSRSRSRRIGAAFHSGRARRGSTEPSLWLQGWLGSRADDAFGRSGTLVPVPTKRQDERNHRLQRGLSHNQRGSKKRAKRRRTLARHAAAIALRRKDALRQATTTRLRTHYYLASARFGVILDMAELERHVRVVFAE